MPSANGSAAVTAFAPHFGTLRQKHRFGQLIAVANFLIRFAPKLLKVIIIAGASYHLERIKQADTGIKHC